MDLVPNDAKCLFRRCQAREALGKTGEAFKDAKLAQHFEPQNKAVLEALQKLSIAAQQKVSTTVTLSVNCGVDSMMSSKLFRK